MNHWLIKTEPGTYSWGDLERDGQTFWDGVRNYQARNNLREMKAGDLCLFYHSVKEKSIVGIAEVVKEHYQDPTTDDDQWVVVDVKNYEKFIAPVSLDRVKKDERLTDMVLIKNPRLSVQPVKSKEFDIILAMAEQEA